jgi:hypothetical protein
MATVTINIYYDANPPFNPRVQGFVNAIFDSCFASLDRDKVVIVWILGPPPKPPGKGWSNSTTLNYELKSTLGPSVLGVAADGQTGSYSSNICPANILAGTTKTGGDNDISTANTVVHEIGIHGIIGTSGHYGKATGTHDVGNAKKTPGLTMGVGQWTSDECSDLKSALGVK